MIDLHIHSNCSKDASDSVEEILSEVEKSRLEVISITDHDSIEAYNKLKNIPITDFYSGRIISGVEINCYFKGAKVEVLGYGYDFEKLNEWMNERYNENKLNERIQKQFDIMIEKVRENNILVESDLKPNLEADDPIGDIWRSMRKFPENEHIISSDCFNDWGTFLREFTTNKNYCLYVNLESAFPSVKEVSKVIRKSGGKAFLAHPFQYKLDNHLEFINELIKENLIDGLECFHYSFSSEQSQRLLDFAKQNNLLISGGTDYHGAKRAEVKLGIGRGNINISKSILDDWNLNDNKFII